MSETILVADDSLRTREATATALARRGSELELLGDGQAALDWLAKTRPSLLIVDVHMARTDGFSVCREAKARHPGLPTILLVGTFEHCDPDRAAECGADDILRKPFADKELLDRVAKILGPAQTASPSSPTPPPTASAIESPPPPAVDEALAAPAPTLSELEVERVARRVLAEMGGVEALEKRMTEAVTEEVRKILGSGDGAP